MAVIRPYSGNKWFHICIARKDPDEEARYFGRYGEFSPYADKSFEKHLQRIEKLNKHFAYLNGARIRAVLNEERLLYLIQGLENLIYK